MHLLAARPRRDLLADVRALQPVIVAQGGATAAAEVYEAVEDVGRWWAWAETGGERRECGTD